MKLFKLNFLLLLIACPTVLMGLNLTIAIIGTNDIHGTALPAIMQRSDTG
jgi:hypothetical protein